MATTTDDAVEGLADQFKGGGIGGGGGKKGPKAGGEGVSHRRESNISRALSRLLRHQAPQAGISLDKEGYAPLEKVVSFPPSFSLGIMNRYMCCCTRSL